jgi:hypothetical protein
VVCSGYAGLLSIILLLGNFLKLEIATHEIILVLLFIIIGWMDRCILCTLGFFFGVCYYGMAEDYCKRHKYE